MMNCDGGGGSMNGVGINSEDAAASMRANDDALSATAASRWETMLSDNYFGGNDFLNNSPANSLSPHAMANTSTTNTTAAAYDPTISQGYATACHLAAIARFPHHEGNIGGNSNSATNNQFYGYHPQTNPNSSSHTMFMPGGKSGGAPQAHFLTGEGLYNHNPQFHLRLPANATQQQQNNSRRRRRQHEEDAFASHSYTINPHSTNYGNYYNTIQNAALGAAAAAMSPSPNRMVDRIVTDDGNGSSFSNTTLRSDPHQYHHPQQQYHNDNHHPTPAAPAGHDDINLNELEYCDALLRGIDDPNNLSWLENVFTTMNGQSGCEGGSSSTVASNKTITANSAHTTAAKRDAFGNNFTTEGERAGISGMLKLFNEHNGGICGFGDSPEGSRRIMMSQQHQQQQQQQSSHTDRAWGDHGDCGGGRHITALGDYLKSQHHYHHRHNTAQPMQQQMQQQQHHTEITRPHTSYSTLEVGSSRGKLPLSTTSSSVTASAVSATSSSLLSPNRTDHSSLPSAQIDPLLEQISLTVTAVSLTPMSGNEVVRHIRNKTDEVITRFLPCVDFLVNCQQELRQGLAVAQQQQQQQQLRGRRGAQSRSNTVMTPRQFHTSYVAPLPNRFKRQYEPLMAREHLRHALISLESLVRDSAAAVPQGNDHVKNAFLGGMRENQSWGLRKWLSEHGGAGSICNDVEEVMRHVKALKKEDETTKRLAEMLRPIARLAHDRLKKDVPAAYQEKSTAHPYLPFFHRLESCLKQMATYDPEEDDVICLEDSDDEDEDVTVLSDKGMTRRSPVATTSRSPMFSKWTDGLVEGPVGNDAKRSRLDLGGRINTTDPIRDEQCEDADRGDRGKTKEPEVICLIDSDDEHDENNTQVHQPTYGLDLGRLKSLSPPPLVRNNRTGGHQNGSISQHGTSTEASSTQDGEQWRCVQCTFLNEAFSKQCVMCNDDDSDGENSTDDLANFLGGSSFLIEGSGDNSFNGSDHFLQLNCLTPTNHIITCSEQNQWRALQSADARELECLAEHISGGGSVPEQAHLQTDKFWAMADTFPQILLLFRSILQHPTSYRFLEPVNETKMFMTGTPEYTSIIKHPLCFHEIVSALSRSEDAVVHPYLTMRLSNGKLAGTTTGELEHWNMWNGLHLIEAIDLVLLNSLAYNGTSENSHQLQIETESLRDSLWEGVNSMLKRLQPHRRRDHLPQRRSVDSGFVVVKTDRR